MEMSTLMAELKYQSYAFSRASSPDVEYKRWGIIYGDVEWMEERYKQEQGKVKHESATTQATKQV